MSLSLTVEVFSQSSITLLVQVLAEDPDARITDLEAAPLAPLADGTRRERLRLAWQEPKGEDQRALILHAFPMITWSEAINPISPAPVPLLFLESDLATVITSVENGYVAGGRRNEARPGWLLAEDRLDAPTVADEPEWLPQVLAKTATFHALHWNAQTVLDEVYPWLPRFGVWLVQQCYTLAAAFGSEVMADARYSAWMQSRYPFLNESLQAIALQRGEELAPLIALCEKPNQLRARVEQCPTTIVQGSYRADSLRFSEGRLYAEQWNTVQVGPAAWDLIVLLQSLGILNSAEQSEIYFTHLTDTIHDLTVAQWSVFLDVLAVGEFLYTLLSPPLTAAGVEAWVEQLVATVPRQL